MKQVHPVRPGGGHPQHRPARRGAERRHRQRQARAQGTRGCAGGPAGQGRPAGLARDTGPDQGRSHCARDLHAGSAKARPGRQRRLQGPDGTGPPDAADPRAVRRLPEEQPGDRRRHPGRVRQVRGGQRRQGIPRPPHPGGKGRRGQGHHRLPQEGRQVRGDRQEAVQGPGLRRQRRRPRLGQRRQLRARVLRRPDQAEEGPDHRQRR